MTSKIDLVFLPHYKSAFLANYIESEIKKYFNLLCYNEDVGYDPKSTIFVSQSSLDQELSYQLHDQGFLVASEDLWEYTEPHTAWHTIASDRWFWINECFWYHQLGYHQGYKIQKTFRKLALMPIGRKKSFRDVVIQRLDPWLNEFIWSYNVKSLAGHCLPNDCVHEDGILWQRYFNPNWYNDTHFSLVVETMPDGLFITEKTFKPLAFRHPFMVLGTPNTLSSLRSWGFETYGNVFDESYDEFPSFEQRLDAVVGNVKNFTKEFYSKETLDKLDHNHYHFFDVELVRRHLYTDIVEPLMDYVNG